MTGATDPRQDDDGHDTLKYHLLGPSLTKAGQEAVDQRKVSEIIYNASKGSKFFHREEQKDKILTQKIERILAKKQQLDALDLASDLRKADELLAQLELSRDLSQTIVHVDCDAFYAAVEALDRPELNDVPFAVGRGVLTTCNYHARKFGCRSGMASFVAVKLCPQLILLPINFEKYTAKAQEVREVLANYDPRFESASVDEAYLNITSYCDRNSMAPEAAVAQMRREIHERTHITVSAGIAANAKLAKICSDRNKPNGQFCLASDRPTIMAFMRDLPLRKVNGVGRVFERELAAIGITTCGDIYAHRQYLWRLFGEKATHFLMQCYLGQGRTNVRPSEEYERKSVGTERTFGDLSGAVELREKLRANAAELEKDLRRAECKGRTLVLKIKLHTYEVFTRQVIPPRAVCLEDDLYRYAEPMLAKLEKEIPSLRLRLMGLRCTHLVSTRSPDTMKFFGFKRKTDDASLGALQKKPKVDEAVWEQWPEAEFEEAVREEHQHELEELESLSQQDDTVQPAPAPIQPRPRSPARHGKEIVPNPRQAVPADDPRWECPICLRLQDNDERTFNEHVDLCLSRQTIREAVQDTADAGSAVTGGGAASARIKNHSGAKKPRNGTAGDSKQQRLFFG